MIAKKKERRKHHRENMELQLQLLIAATATPAATAATTPAATAPSPAAATNIIAQGVLTPPAKAREWFTEDANVVLMTDGALAYRQVDFPGIYVTHYANHSALEYVRSGKIITNVVTRAEDHCKIGCQKAEGAWSHISECVPRALVAPTCPLTTEQES